MEFEELVATSAAAAATRSRKRKTEHLSALRFARVKGYRTDKAPDQADTIDAARATHGQPTQREAD